MERHNRNYDTPATRIISTSSGENSQQRPNLENLFCENNKKEQISTNASLYRFSDSSNNGDCTANKDTIENKGSNVSNVPNCKSSEKYQSPASLMSSINHEINIYYDNAGANNSSVNKEVSEIPNSAQSFVINQPNHFLESEYLTSTDIAPASFYENLIEQMDKSIIMLKKSLDKVLEMRVSTAELKLSLKEISSPELVCKAEELSTQLTALEASHSRFNEMVLSLKHEIRPSANSDIKVNRDRI